jgi:hypothetical protein
MGGTRSTYGRGEKYIQNLVVNVEFKRHEAGLTTLVYISLCVITATELRGMGWVGQEARMEEAKNIYKIGLLMLNLRDMKQVLPP